MSPDEIADLEHDDRVWIPVAVDGASTQWYVCRRHPEEPRFTAISLCSGCTFASHPKQTEVGLLATPAWWEHTSTVAVSPRRQEPEDESVTHYRPGFGLRCTEHSTLFAVDEACAQCVEADDAMEGS